MNHSPLTPRRKPRDERLFDHYGNFGSGTSSDEEETELPKPALDAERLRALSFTLESMKENSQRQTGPHWVQTSEGSTVKLVGLSLLAAVVCAVMIKVFMDLDFLDFDDS
eukprot:Opistho-2@79871